MAIVTHATAGKIRCVDGSSKPLHLSQATKTKILFKAFIIFLLRKNVSSTLWSVLCVKYSMWENQKHHFFLRFNNHRSDVIDRKAIPPCRHYVQEKRRFNIHVKFTLIESITNTNKSKDSTQEFLKKRENVWIRTLETLQPKGLSHELNPK